MHSSGRSHGLRVPWLIIRCHYDKGVSEWIWVHFKSANCGKHDKSWDTDEDYAQYRSRLAPIMWLFDTWKRIYVSSDKTNYILAYRFIFIISYAQVYALVVHSNKPSIAVLTFESWFVYMYQSHQLMNFPVASISFDARTNLRFSKIYKFTLNSLVL